MRAKPRPREPLPQPNTGPGARVVAALDGSPAAVHELEGWIRREVATHYPVLRTELEDVCQAVHLKLVTNTGRDYAAMFIEPL